MQCNAACTCLCLVSGFLTEELQQAWKCEHLHATGFKSLNGCPVQSWMELKVYFDRFCDISSTATGWHVNLTLPTAGFIFWVPWILKANSRPPNSRGDVNDWENWRYKDAAHFRATASCANQPQALRRNWVLHNTCEADLYRKTRNVFISLLSMGLSVGTESHTDLYCPLDF